MYVCNCSKPSIESGFSSEEIVEEQKVADVAEALDNLPLFPCLTGTGLSDGDHSGGGAGSVTMNAVELIETQFAP
jgi:hypothetical protein